MFYVYVLKTSKGGQMYIGYTSDLKRRIKEHMSLQSEYTKSRLPIGLVYYEAFASEKDARTRELNLKQFKGSYGQRILNSIQTFK